MAAQQTITTLEKALKELHLFEDLVDVYRQSDFAWSNLKTRGGRLTTLGGRSMAFSLQKSSNPSFRGMSPGEPVAESGVPTFGEATVTLATHSAQVQFDIWSEGYTKATEASYVKATAHLLSDTVKAWGDKMSKLIWATGTGAMGVVNSVVGSTITLYAEGTAGALSTRGIKGFYPGQKISASANQTGTSAELTLDAEISTINYDNNTMVVTPAPAGDIVQGSIIYWGSKARTSKNRVIDGFRKAFDDGTLVATLHGIDRTIAGNEFWKGNVGSSFGTGNLEMGFLTKMHLVQTKIKAMTDIIITSLGVHRAFFNELKEDRRAIVPVSSAGASFNGGFDALTMHDGKRSVPVIADQEVPTGTAWGFRWSDFFLGTMYEPQWLDRGEGIFKNKPEHLEYAAYFFAIQQLVCRQPQAQWLLTGITEA